jgi:heme exporter protein A
VPALGAPALELEGLVRNHGERQVLEGVSLSLDAGATLVVFGPNGAGKTTLLRVLATLLRPHGGSVRVLGSALPRESWAVRGRIGMLGHEPMLYRELSARENLCYHARLHRCARGRVEEMLERVGMRKRADEPLRTLSRGMVQRIAIARAVLHDPELLLLDEPYAHLDPAARELVDPLLGARDEFGWHDEQDGREERGEPDERVALAEPGAIDGPAARDARGARTVPGGGAARARPRARTRVIASHDPTGGPQEADLVLGLRAGRVAVLRERASVDSSELAELYR